MIYYECPRCKVPMSSPDSMAGKPETCPECEYVVAIPTAKNQDASASDKKVDFGDNGEKFLYRANPMMFHGDPVGFVVCCLLIPLGLGLIILLFWWLHCKYHELRISNTRTTLRTGILSENTNEVRHIDVRNIRVRQSFLQRIFDTGTLEISTAGTGVIELSIGGIPRPKQACELIRQRQT